MPLDRVFECSICFTHYSTSNNSPELKGYNPKYSVGCACKKCTAIFNDREIEILIHVFNVARGSFQLKGEDDLRIMDVLYDIQSVLMHKKKDIEPNRIFSLILKRAKQYKLFLKSYIQHNIISSSAEYQREREGICNICHKKLSQNITTSEPKNDKGDICSECRAKFDEPELRKMDYLFKKYGGFYNKLNSKESYLTSIIQELIDDINHEADYSKLFELNEKALHKALLFGFPPSEFLEELNK
jgi:hypothetical protein